MPEVGRGVQLQRAIFVSYCQKEGGGKPAFKINLTPMAENQGLRFHVPHLSKLCLCYSTEPQYGVCHTTFDANSGDGSPISATFLTQRSHSS